VLEGWGLAIVEKELTVSVRAIWQGNLSMQKHEVAVKLYSAVLDREIHFHLLHKRDHTRVEQRMVDAETEEAVPLEQTNKAFEVEPGVYLTLTREEIEATAPPPGRTVKISRFVPIDAVEPQLFDRPYFLGPTEDSTADYFALAEAVGRKKRVGIASWVMRKHAYVGALISQQGFLMLITLRHASDVIHVEELDPPQGRALDAKEKDMAEKLIAALSGEFDPTAYRDEYQNRVRELIQAKLTGKKIKAKRAPRRRHEGSLAESLRESLRQVTANRGAKR
jgi:DNA end-binding protein Ku